MNKNIDIKYLCTQLNNLTGVPVRLYEKDKEILFASIVAFPEDPFKAYKKDVLSISDHIGYFITEQDNYYGVVNYGEYHIVVGPTSQMPLSDQTLREIAFLSGVKSDVNTFVNSMKRIAPLSLMSVLQHLCLTNHVLNGETISLVDVTIIEPKQNEMKTALNKATAERAIDSEPPAIHGTTDVENYLIELIKSGDVEGLKKFFASMPAIQGGTIAQNDIRQAKNLLIVTATLVSRAVMRSGMNAEEALTLSDTYIQKCELMHNVEEVTNLNYRLIMDYAEKMKKILLGGNASKLAIEVNNYIRTHLSEPITVENIAQNLHRGRSRLSTDFKKETGQNLSDFILSQKIEESKKLLLYTDKPAVDIAIYLGFSSQSHFSRTFKKYVGVTPNEFRKNA